MIVYLAGSISGKSYDSVVHRLSHTHKTLSDQGYEVLSPMTGKGVLRNETILREQDYSNPVSTNHAIYGRDQWMVRKCDVVLADLSDTDKVSIGTMMELAWASILGKHVVTVLPKDNIHRHAFVIESSDIIFESLEEAIGYFEELYNGYS